MLFQEGEEGGVTNGQGNLKKTWKSEGINSVVVKPYKIQVQYILGIRE